MAEASSNLSRFDGVRYGYRDPEAQSLEDLYELSRTKGFGPEVQRRIIIGTYVLSAGYYDAYYRKAAQVRRLIRQDFLDAFKQCDIICGPTSPFVAYPIGDMPPRVASTPDRALRARREDKMASRYWAAASTMINEQEKMATEATTAPTTPRTQ